MYGTIAIDPYHYDSNIAETELYWDPYDSNEPRNYISSEQQDYYEPGPDEYFYPSEPEPEPYKSQDYDPSPEEPEEYYESTFKEVIHIEVILPANEWMCDLINCGIITDPNSAKYKIEYNRVLQRYLNVYLNTFNQ